jgi:hypothetical protein
MAYTDLYNNYSSVAPSVTPEETEANTRPVTQTITTDPVTGQQMMTVRGRPEDLTSANPYTPTVSGPAVPGAQPAMGRVGLRATPDQFMPQMGQPAPAMAPGAPMGGVGLRAEPQQFMPQMGQPAAPAAEPRFTGEPTARAPMAAPAGPGILTPGMPTGAPPTGPAVPGAYDPNAMTQALAQQMQQAQARPMQPIAAVAGAPTSDVNPPAVTQPMGGTGLRMPGAAPAPMAAPAAEPAAIAPTPMPAEAPTAEAPAAAPLPATQGLALTARAESGGNDRYKFDYHYADRRTDAWGKYGILSSTYGDIQNRDPYFKDKPLTQLNEADQDRAAMVIRNMNADSLKALQVPPTEANLQLAHFLGAKGAADFLATGYISPQAAAANGGLARATETARSKIMLGGGDPNVVPVSAQVANLPAWNSQVIGIQDDAARLHAYVGNPDNPKEARDAAALILKSKYKEEELTAKAQKQVTDAIKNGDWKTLQSILQPSPSRKKKEDEDGVTLGGIAKAFLYSAIGFQSGAQDVVAKMGIGAKWDTTTIGEDQVAAKFRKDGSAIQGQFISGPRAGEKLSQDELDNIAGGGGGGANVNKTETMIDPATGQVVSHQTLSNGKEKFTVGGVPFTGDKKGLVPERQFSAAEDRRVNTALESLRRNVPNPSQAQVQQALITARIPNRRIEQEMGITPGSLGTGSGRTSTGGAMPPAATGAMPPAATGAMPPAATGAMPPAATGAMPPAATGAVPPAATGAVPPAAARPVITPDLQPEPPVLRDIRQGEPKTSYDAYAKAENDAYKKRLEAYQNRVKLEQTEAQAFRDKAISTRSQLNTIKDAVEIVKSGEYLMGPLLGTEGSKKLPSVQEFFASKFGDQTTTDNTRSLRSLITKGGLEGIKDYMGPSISNFDVVAWLKANPITEQSSPQALEKYFTKLYNTLHDLSEQKRLNAVKHGMIEPSFNFPPKFDSGSTAQTEIFNQADEILRRGKK